MQQSGRPSQMKDSFYPELQDTTDTIKYKEKLVICGDFNGIVECIRNHIEGGVGPISVGGRNEG